MILKLHLGNCICSGGFSSKTIRDFRSIFLFLLDWHSALLDIVTNSSDQIISTSDRMPNSSWSNAQFLECLLMMQFVKSLRNALPLAKQNRRMYRRYFNEILLWFTYSALQSAFQVFGRFSFHFFALSSLTLDSFHHSYKYASPIVLCVLDTCVSLEMLNHILPFLWLLGRCKRGIDF